MNQKWKRFCRAMCAALVVILSSVPCYAAEKENKCEVSVPVQVDVAGDTAPKKELFEVSITSKEAKTPMPEVTVKTVEGSGKISFGPICYTIPDDYHYVITQKKGSAPHWTYDQTVYEVTVRIVNDKEKGLAAEVWAVKSGSNEKTDKIRFVNRYDAPEVYDPPKNEKPPKDYNPPKVYTAPTMTSPHTGDLTNAGLYAGLMGGSALVLLTAFWKGRRYFKQLK